MTVLVVGCFDILHVGHLRFLEAARAHGSRLVVGVSTDGFMRRVRGKHPVNNQLDRLGMISALRIVDEALMFDTADFVSLAQKTAADVFVFSEEHSEKRFTDVARYMTTSGRLAVQIPRTPGISTTEILERAKHR